MLNLMLYCLKNFQHSNRMSLTPVQPGYHPIGTKRGVPYPRLEMVYLEKQTYKPMGQRSPTMGNFLLVFQTETLIIYHDQGNQQNYVVAIRGTNKYDSTDWYADYLIASGMLKDSDRFKSDKTALARFQEGAPPTNYGNLYYGVGHSLGGAIMDEFILSGMILSGISFNPAVESRNNTLTANQRIYAYHDPLYYLQGRYTTAVERLPEEPSSVWGQIFDYLKFIPSVYVMKGTSDYLYYHKLERFMPGQQGGYRGGRRKERIVSMPRNEYLAEHKQLLDVLKNPTPEKLKKEYTKQKKEVATMVGGKSPCWEGHTMYGMKQKKGKKVPNCVRGGANTDSIGQKKDEAINILEGLRGFASSTGNGPQLESALASLRSVDVADACSAENQTKVRNGKAEIDDVISKNSYALYFAPDTKQKLERVKTLLSEVESECSVPGIVGGYNRTTPATNCKTQEWNCVKTSGRYYGSDFGGVVCYDTDPQYCMDDRRWPDGPPYEMYG